MEKCENCGNDYYKAFQIIFHGKEYTFDSFECAINALAPKCEACETRIIGHGVETSGKMFCCAHCAKKKGVHELRDHV